MSPTIDENSIKVEGTGAAVISDIAIELLPNREIFEDIYPESEDEDKSDTDDDSTDEDEDDSSEFKEVRRKIQALHDDRNRAVEVVSSAENRLQFLDAYGKMLDRKRSLDIDVGIENYRAERAKVFQDHMDSTVRIRELDESITELNKEASRLARQQFKVAQKKTRVRQRIKEAKNKKKAKKQRREAEVAKEKLRLRHELEKYWPRKCYTVRITLDAPSFTPSSSRRTSFSSATELAKPVLVEAEGSGDGIEGGDWAACDLSISYVTSSAFWAPTYDLQLSTTANTAALCFDAQLTNTTSESWTNCKVILSTSQTNFSGLNDAIPTLIPWHVKLARGYGYDGILQSREEQSHKNVWQTQQNALVINQKPRGELFGVDSRVSANMDMAKKSAQAAVHRGYMVAREEGHQQMMQQVQAYGLQPTAGRFGSRAPGASAPSMPAPPPPPLPAMSMPMPKLKRASIAAQRGPIGGGGAIRRRMVVNEEASEEEEAEDDSEDTGMDLDGTILPEPSQELEFQESSFEETGMTTTYDLPGLKSLVPSSTSSKQRVARISFQNVVFSHTVVAKYKPAAFLKARLKNASKLTLLKGQAGLTLDGSFMGRTSLPRCSAGDTFTLSLGVDPAIRVAYPKPDVKRATTGIFSKEDSSVYKRSITIANTRANAGKAVTLVVLDQVPVSEDEKLRVGLQQPPGLTTVRGAGVVTGVGLAPSGQPATAANTKDWGTATAMLKKGGEVVWDVKLNAGRTVRLDLEYDVNAPSGEGVIQC